MQLAPLKRDSSAAGSLPRPTSSRPGKSQPLLFLTGFKEANNNKDLTAKKDQEVDGVQDQKPLPWISRKTNEVACSLFQMKFDTLYPSLIRRRRWSIQRL